MDILILSIRAISSAKELFKKLYISYIQIAFNYTSFYVFLKYSPLKNNHQFFFTSTTSHNSLIKSQFTISKLLHKNRISEGLLMEKQADSKY